MSMTQSGRVLSQKDYSGTTWYFLKLSKEEHEWWNRKQENRELYIRICKKLALLYPFYPFQETELKYIKMTTAPIFMNRQLPLLSVESLRRYVEQIIDLYHRMFDLSVYGQFREEDFVFTLEQPEEGPERYSLEIDGISCLGLRMLEEEPECTYSEMLRNTLLNLLKLRSKEDKLLFPGSEHYSRLLLQLSVEDDTMLRERGCFWNYCNQVKSVFQNELPVALEDNPSTVILTAQLGTADDRITESVRQLLDMCRLSGKLRSSEIKICRVVDDGTKVFSSEWSETSHYLPEYFSQPCSGGQVLQQLNRRLKELGKAKRAIVLLNLCGCDLRGDSAIVYPEMAELAGLLQKNWGYSCHILYDKAELPLECYKLKDHCHLSNNTRALQSAVYQELQWLP